MTLKTLTDSLRREVAALDLQQTDYAVYRDDPVGFVRDVLGVESATRRSDGGSYQFEILADLANHARVAVRSGHGVGKSAVDAWAALWWLLTRPLSRVLMVAPTFERQVKAVLMSEVRKWVRHAGLPVQVLSTGAHVDGFGDEWAIIGLPATPEHVVRELRKENVWRHDGIGGRESTKVRDILVSDPISRLNAALKGRYCIEHKVGESGMARRVRAIYNQSLTRWGLPVPPPL